MVCGEVFIAAAGVCEPLGDVADVMGAGDGATGGIVLGAVEGVFAACAMAATGASAVAPANSRAAAVRDNLIS